ncbi:PSP1 domain-containing protein [Actinorugispora endophytica]|uniref:Cell fate regulator YaaT (PSP1 superfamily) n=1 Tax=Actinorugispora endophytica TaxID=1605990 RepID=A0A4R6V3W0_9ACTN|nr:regulatory iron-sulfur-containing complex subunit RicT [Actinorugispora endophytica]TDQ54971.1 cell fate regulator YaaT (PSP1 superfamily) [Actinorugispora endophytica]
MPMMMAVSFERYGRLHYLDPGATSPRVGDKVLVPTDEGPEVAECVWAPQWVSEEVDGLPVCEGIATEDDLARDEYVRRRRAEVRPVAKRLIRARGLRMKIVGVDYVAARNAFTVYFSAPSRVDFRALVRELSRTLEARVRLRQVAARDEARLQGGIGPCGRDLCCATFLKDFEPVTMRMAKDQGLPANPMRISGACGKLMCCLKYEHPLYQEFKADVPAGGRVRTPDGDGVVVGHNVPAEKVVVRLSASGRRCACDRSDVCGPRQAYEGSHGGDDGTESGSA